MAVIQQRSPSSDVGPPTLVVHGFGPVTVEDLDYARRVVEGALAVSPVSVSHATIDLRLENGPEWERPALARVVVEHAGRMVPVHADATELSDAVDLVGLRLRRRLEAL
jgi:hypothetical protein